MRRDLQLPSSFLLQFLVKGLIEGEVVRVEISQAGGAGTTTAVQAPAPHRDILSRGAQSGHLLSQ